MDKRLAAKCASCGHVWTVVHLPVDAGLLGKFCKTPCPKCYAPKPLMAGKNDLTTEDRLTELLRRCHDAMSRRDPNRITNMEWDQLLQDIEKETGSA